ncbi:AlwI family type II restriction endonuclease [Geobacillus stearothermophilus]|uniref:AlwI family type II restriction endonuclease n=1 Tax=Geobacillus stearothermophilus TaxID=1422 RepID=UPI002E1F19E2|nr:AlwI family type II restriction endonuclease [Geobacillus stearothermophilus]
MNEKNTRKVWFITRPERDPRFHQEALLALQKATDDFRLKWAGNREVHKRYEEELANMGIKRNNISHDGSGGRTWMAMLKTFSYCYVDDDGYIRLTKVGEKLIQGEKVYENTRKQVLTLQYPNAYFLEPGFRPKFDEGFRIRPVLFLIKLANDERLDFYVTKEEITYFAMTAQKDSQLDEIVHKILAFRKAGTREREEMKQDIAAKFDHRERSDKGARDFYEAHSDVAHTFMLISDYTGLVEYIRGKALKGDSSRINEIKQEIAEIEKRYPFNTRYMISLERMAENSGLDVDSYKASRYGNIKPAANSSKLRAKAERILAQFPSIESMSKEEIAGALQKYLSPRDIEKVIHEIVESKDDFEGINSDFVEAYLNEKDNLAFEDKTGQIFSALGFDVAMRPKAKNGERTEIEIIAGYGGSKFGIIDAKNYAGKFPLSSSLASHMASEYIPNYTGYEGKELTFFGYVTANDFTGERNLEKISDKAKRITGNPISGFLVTARTLLGFLDYCIENDVPLEDRAELFVKAVKNKGYKSLEALLRELKETS